MSNNLDLKREIARLKEKNARLEEKLRQNLGNPRSSEIYFLEQILESAGICVVIHDFKQVLYANKPVLERLKTTEENFVGKSPASFVPHKLKPEVLKRQNRLRNNEFVEPMEETYTAFDGTTVKVVVSGFPITYEGKKAVFLIIIDKTDEKKFIWENKKWLEIIEEIPASIFVADKDQNIEYVNRFFSLYTGYAKEEVLGKKPVFLCSDMYDDQYRQKVEETVRSGKIFEGQMIIKKKNGDHFWADVRAKAILNEEGEIQSFFNFSLDITDKVETIRELTLHKAQLNERVEEKTKELEEKNRALERSAEALALMLEDLQEQRKEMKRINEELMEANRDLDAFNSSISHDLKSPANRIATLATLLKNHYGQAMDAQAVELINDIVASAAEMSNLIESMLLFARAGIEKPDIVEIDLKPLVQAVFEEKKEDCKQPGAKLTLGEMHPFEGDYPLIKQVVYNLITNSFKYSRPDVPLEINVYSERDETKKYVTYHFGDNGTGFTDEEAGKIFDFLYRSQNAGNREGTGIGLAIVKKIITRHHGKLTAKGEPGKGAVISFTVPVNYNMNTHENKK